MQPLTIPGNLVRAALECAGKNDVRTYLNGVTVEVMVDGTVVVMGTNGHILFAGWTTLEGQEAPKVDLPIIFTVPRADLDAAIKADKSADLQILDPKADKLAWGRLSFGRLQDHNPTRFEWRNAVPGETFDKAPEDRKVPMFNIDYLVSARKALGHVDGRHTPTSLRRLLPQIRYGKTANDAAIMVSHNAPDALVVLMPLRGESVPGHRNVPSA